MCVRGGIGARIQQLFSAKTTKLLEFLIALLRGDLNQEIQLTENMTFNALLLI